VIACGFSTPADMLALASLSTSGIAGAVCPNRPAIGKTPTKRGVWAGRRG